LSELPDGGIALDLKTPWSDGTTHVLYEPADLIAKRDALVPRPWKNVVLLPFRPDQAFRRVSPGPPPSQVEWKCAHA